jgi:fermentation-respiration switch protein FrsA (DUF1100 family)
MARGALSRFRRRRHRPCCTELSRHGGSSGQPTETGLITDAHAAYAFAAARYPVSRIALWGESLGSGVAIALATEKPVGRIVLESPFTSIADVAAQIYWFLPVRWLIKDPFRSDLRVGKVTAPVLILHGERDGVVPIALGERLYALITSPKRFLRYSSGGQMHHEPGLIAYECSECGYVTSVIVPPAEARART